VGILRDCFAFESAGVMNAFPDEYLNRFLIVAKTLYFRSDFLILWGAPFLHVLMRL
jgi:hypothetical protein